MSEFESEIDAFLQSQAQSSAIRTLHPITHRQGMMIQNGIPLIDFASNDYLGLSQHPKLIQAAKDALDTWGVGSTGSRLLSGDTDLIHSLETKLAKFKHKESALVFNSGYQANVGIIPALAQGDTVIFYDKLSHASMIDGILLSKAPHYRYRHNDLNHLETILKKYRQNHQKAIIMTESIFSMEGDSAPLKELVALKSQYDCLLFLDEAHATGIFGKTGAGLVEQEGVSGEIDIIMGTFSKALGSFGAYIATSDRIKNFIVNTCRSFIFSTALPAPVIAANSAAIDIVLAEPNRRSTVLKNADRFRTQLKARGYSVRGCSQIVPVMIGNNQETVQLSEKLKNAGMQVFPIRHPTVPKGEERLRFSFSAIHTDDMITQLVNAF